MVFSTIIFLCAFLPIVILGYYLIPKQGKNLFLLICSLFFYAWGEPVYVFIMLASILCNYLFGLVIANYKRKQTGGKLFLTVAVLVNLGILCVFKYSGFLAENIDRVMPGLLKIPAIALPIGISFYTFQGLSYCIDVYRDEKLVQKNPINLALYISMFPQLIAGPIVRYSDIRASLTDRKHSSAMFAEGAERFIIGLAKKAILANSVGVVATHIMTSEFQYMGAAVAWLGAVCYTLQIYFDFSGYSDMAIGLGKIFGFSFAENFNYPYISRSVREFWRRWHISLSSWFRDYLYIPMGGSRTGNVYLHLLIVFLATGIWHGAAWGFLLWGLWHGCFIILERMVSEKRKAYARERNAEFADGKADGKICGDVFKDKESNMKNKNGNSGVISYIKSVCGWVYTVLVVIVGWVLFALVSVRKTAEYPKIMFGIRHNSLIAYKLSYYLDKRALFILIIAVLACIPWKQAAKKLFGENEKIRSITESFAYSLMQKICLLALLVLCFVFIITGSYNPFIYFRF